MKYSFIVTVLCGLLVIGGACTHENDPEDGKRTNQTPLIVKATASNFNHLSISGSPFARTPLEDGAETQFSAGDAIGIFAVKNNAIADAVNNIKLTYKKTGIDTGEWIPPAGTSLYWNEGMDYIAYYPYKEGVTIDTGKTIDEIMTSLVDNEKLKPGADQSGSDEYTACDLMTAVGKVSEETLTFEFEHRFALLILKPQAHFKYVPPADAVFTYRNNGTLSDLTVDVTAKNVKLNNVTPCKMDDGSFRAIVLPTKTATAIAGSYSITDVSTSGTSTDKTLTYSFTPSTAFTAGCCYTLEVKSPLSAIEKTRELTPGDFVFFTANNKIEIFPGDGVFEGNTIPDYKDAAGMVITCDPERMTDERCNKKGWNHAYVMMLDSLKEGNWGPMDLIEADIDTISIADVKSKHDFSRIKNNMNGYSETLQMLANHEGDASFVSDCRAFYLVKTYNNSNKVPDGIERSPWFLPSIGQWFDVLVNICGKSPENFRHNTGNGLQDEKWGLETLDKLKGQLSKVGKSLPQFNVNHRLGFSCSSQYDKDRNWMLLWHIDDPLYKWERVCLQGYNKTSVWHVRPFFAF